MFDCLYIASLTAHHFLDDKVHMYCTSKQIDVLVMASSHWLNMNIIYSYTIYLGIGEDCPKEENTGKLQAGKRYTNELSKILEEFPPGEEEYTGKLLPVNRNTNWFKRILWEFRAGKGNIWENFRLYKGNVFPSRKSLVSDIPAGEGKIAKSFFMVYCVEEV